MKPKRSMVRVAFVSLLIAGMVVVGAVRAEEDNDESPRSSVLTVVEEGRPVPVPALARKLTKNSKASQEEAAVSEEMQSLWRVLVYKTAVDLNRFSMQSSQSLAGGFGRELQEVPEKYTEYACDECLAFFEATRPRQQQQDIFCQRVVNVVAFYISPSPGSSMTRDLLNEFCIELMQCPSTPTVCCQTHGYSCVSEKKKTTDLI